MLLNKDKRLSINESNKLPSFFFRRLLVTANRQRGAASGTDHFTFCHAIAAWRRPSEANRQQLSIMQIIVKIVGVD